MHILMNYKMSFKVIIDYIILFLYASAKAGSLVSVQNMFILLQLIKLHVTFDLY